MKDKLISIITFILFFQIFIQTVLASTITLGSGVNITNGTIIRLSGSNCNITVKGNYIVTKLEVYSDYFLINASLTAPIYVNLSYSYNSTTKIINITCTANTEPNLVINSYIPDGFSCSANNQCSNGYCVHSICRSSSIYCGDGYCDSSETCSSCSSDCGACSSSGCPHSVRIKDVEDVNAKAGETVLAKITVKNRGCYDEENIKVYIECAEDWECESKTIPELEKHESISVDLEIKAPIEVAPKIYHFDVIAENAFYRNVNELDIVIGKLCKKDSDCETGEICLERICQSLFDIEIIRAGLPIEPGKFLDFTYLMKSMSNISGDVKVNFWIEQDGEKIVDGSDTIYLGTLEEKVKTTSLYIPTTISIGVYDFYVQVTQQDYKVYAHRPIEIGLELPLISDIESPEEKEQIPIYIVLLIVGIIAVSNYRKF